MDALDRIDPPVRRGERLVVRHRLPDGAATDVVGWLEDLDSDELGIRSSQGREVRVQRRTIVAARRAPAARGGRSPLRTSAEELERLALSSWVAEQQPLGEWTLRAGGGFTGRANSCLAVGDPGLPTDAAAQRIVDFSAEHGIPARAQVIDGSAAEQQLRELGWSDVYVPTAVLVTRLAELLGDELVEPRVVLTDELEPDWLAAYGRSRPNQADPAVLRAILTGAAPRAFAGVEAEGDMVAIGRGHVADDWLGLSSIWTEPGWRRQGLAGHVVTALGHWAARLGARYVYLQVAAANTVALQAYARMGFVRHHGYRYLGPPGSEETARSRGNRR